MTVWAKYLGSFGTAFYPSEKLRIFARISLSTNFLLCRLIFTSKMCYNAFWDHIQTLQCDNSVCWILDQCRGHLLRKVVVNSETEDFAAVVEVLSSLQRQKGFKGIKQLYVLKIDSKFSCRKTFNWKLLPSGQRLELTRETQVVVQF